MVKIVSIIVLSVVDHVEEELVISDCRVVCGVEWDGILGKESTKRRKGLARIRG